MTRPIKSPTQAKAPTKIAQVRALLGPPEGVTLAALVATTGWQAHSLRAALSLLTKAGTAVERLPRADGAAAARYRLVPPDAAPTDPAPTVTTSTAMVPPDEAPSEIGATTGGAA